ncbi:hypothetical protein Tther_00697 [Tepidimonas thermarum]|uniref:Uncharacterized protein n=1 Tax=Tepidimonas thermarum TaxID=335431 RepID=A0A554X575_9BURK|nr:hypothetical protein [Tepidimonas thermarum]TSE30989.1 hypothetical protein Tther_00697 [Tepidimonas thermarum]
MEHLSPVEEWSSILARTPAAVREHIGRVVRTHKAALAEAFYAEMLQHPQGRLFLDADIVHQRLHASM